VNYDTQESGPNEAESTGRQIFRLSTLDACILSILSRDGSDCPVEARLAMQHRTFQGVLRTNPEKWLVRY